MRRFVSECSETTATSDFYHIDGSADLQEYL